MPDRSTQLIHHPYLPPAGFVAPQTGVFKASTVIFPNVAALRTRDWKSKSGYSYGLMGTPTTYLLEERLCTLEGGLQCLLLPSGLAAIATVGLALLRAGDELLLPDNVYGPSKALAEGEFAAWGISHRFYDPMNPADLAAKLSNKTKLVWLEAAGSVTMEFPDLPALLRVSRAHQVLVALDNTWGAGLAFQAFDLVPGAETLGVDISVQALTKYPSGGGDVLMGSVITRDVSLHHQLKLTHMHLGQGVAANDVEAVLRSLPSLALRYQAHDRAARSLAQWFQGRSEIVQVLHPALAESPGHKHWKALCATEGQGGAAGLFSVLFHPRYSQDQVDAFCDALQRFKLGYSWGGPMSLVVPYDLPTIRSSWPAQLQQGRLVRFSVGLESVVDLQADLSQALDRMA